MAAGNAKKAKKTANAGAAKDPKKTDSGEGFSYPTKLIIAFASGGLCALCLAKLVADTEDGDKKRRGEAAHIAGEESLAARYDSTMTDTQRNHHSNGLYLCPDDHDKIDVREPYNFPTPRLQMIKTEHEANVEKSVIAGLGKVKFKELKLICSRLMEFGTSTPAPANYDLTAIEEKIKINNLGPRSQRYITMGLSLEQEVQDFIDAETLADPDFPIKLRDGFRAEYYAKRQAGLRGDELYVTLLSLASSTDPDEVAAVISVLAYLFEKCEVFEKS